MAPSYIKQINNISDLAKARRNMRVMRDTAENLELWGIHTKKRRQEHQECLDEIAALQAQIDTYEVAQKLFA